MAEFAFDASKVKPQSEFVPIPAGKYVAIIIKSELKTTKKGDGNYLELNFQIIDGQYKNRQLWGRLNLRNPNSQTVEIAQQQLSSICHAVGVLDMQDTQQLHNIPLCVKVVVRDGNNGPMNDVNGYYPLEGQQQAPVQQAAPVQQPPVQQQAFVQPQQPVQQTVPAYEKKTAPWLTKK
jgi:hypothetical protein